MKGTNLLGLFCQHCGHTPERLTYYRKSFETAPSIFHMACWCGDCGIRIGQWHSYSRFSDAAKAKIPEYPGEDLPMAITPSLWELP